MPNARRGPVMIGLPALADSLAFLFHWMAGTPELRNSIVASMIFSALSALFNLYAMRRGVLVVGQTARSFTDDLRSLPGVAVAFIQEGRRLLRCLLRSLARVRSGRSS